MNHELANWAFLTKRRKRWKRLPLGTREELCRCVAKVGRIRAQIGADAPVREMPPIEVLDEIWISADGESSIDGRASPIVIGENTWFGAQLPASTVLLPDALIRGILVHEFAHCFFYLTQCINAEDSGFSGGALQLGLGDDHQLLGRDRDDAMLVNANEWFGPADAKALMHWDDHGWDDEALEAQAQAFGKLRPWLPVKTPDTPFVVHSLTYAQEVAVHIRSLRNSHRRP